MGKGTRRLPRVALRRLGGHLVNRIRAHGTRDASAITPSRYLCGQSSSKSESPIISDARTVSRAKLIRRPTAFGPGDPNANGSDGLRWPLDRAQ